MTHDDFLQAAARVGAYAEEVAAQADRDSGFPAEFGELIRSQQLHRLLRPRAHGGHAQGPRTFAEVIRKVAYHNCAAAWLAYFFPLHEQWVAYLPAAARTQVFESDGFVADIFGPIGQVTYVDGGVKLSGQWNWGSGILFCDWVGLGASVKVPGHGDAPQPCLVTVHKSQFEVIRNWDCFGLRATGSHAVKVQDVFVPWSMVLPVTSTKVGGQPVDGHYESEAPIFRQPFMASFLMGFIAIALGAAERMMDELLARTKKRQRALYGTKEWESLLTQRNIGELDAKLEMIRAGYDRYVARLEACVKNGESVLDEGEEMRLGALRSMVVAEARDLAFRAFELLGGTAAYKGDPVERIPRDLFMVSVHITQAYEDHMAARGRTMFGVPAGVMG